MSEATDELRRMLDERGVEWIDDSYAQLWCTVWLGQDGKQWRMTENRSGMLTELKSWHATPEQAIAATLGRGTCHSIDPVDSSEFFICSNCNYGAGIVEFIPNYCPNCGRRVEVDG